MKNTRMHPGEFLAEILEANGLSVEALADGLHLPTVWLELILEGKRGISADLALRLAKYFDTVPHLWMSIQNSYDLSVAAHDGRLAA